MAVLLFGQVIDVFVEKAVPNVQWIWPELENGRTDERSNTNPGEGGPYVLNCGEVLSDLHLCATCEHTRAAAGSSCQFLYQPPLGTKLGAGQHNLTVTVSCGKMTSLLLSSHLIVSCLGLKGHNYEVVQKTVTVTVEKVAPTVLWKGEQGPAPIPTLSLSYGTPISEDKHLAAVAFYRGEEVPGCFRYLPPPGTLLQPGSHTLSVLYPNLRRFRLYFTSLCPCPVV